MKNFLEGGCKARNNEEYKVILKKRRIKMMFCAVAGAIVSVLGYCLFTFADLKMSDFQMGIISGFGMGLAIGSVMIIIQIGKTLADEEKIKKERLKETDEREIEVGRLALAATTKVLIAVLYIMTILGGLFMEELMYISCGLIFLFCLIFTCFKCIYNKMI